MEILGVVSYQDIYFVPILLKKSLLLTNRKNALYHRAFLQYFSYKLVTLENNLKGIALESKEIFTKHKKQVVTIQFTKYQAMCVTQEIILYYVSSITQ